MTPADDQGQPPPRKPSAPTPAKRLTLPHIPSGRRPKFLLELLGLLVVLMLSIPFLWMAAEKVRSGNNNPPNPAGTPPSLNNPPPSRPRNLPFGPGFKGTGPVGPLTPLGPVSPADPRSADPLSSPVPNK